MVSHTTGLSEIRSRVRQLMDQSNCDRVGSGAYEMGKEGGHDAGDRRDVGCVDRRSESEGSESRRRDEGKRDTRESQTRTIERHHLDETRTIDHR